MSVLYSVCCSFSFSSPKKFEFHAQGGDVDTILSDLDPIKEDLVMRYQQLQKRVTDLKLENEEVALITNLQVVP